MAESCIFCRIARGEIPATIVAESSLSLAFRDIGAQAPTHVLVIPRVHVTSLNQLDDATVLADMFSLVRRVASAEGIAESGYRVVVNTNADGGQSVYHLHLHLLGGRAMAWPPG
jgi:histidine triad (HIT) family protein